MKYKNWLNEWLAYYVVPTTKERTYRKYSRQIEQHILPQLGEYEIDNLTAYIIQKFIVGLSDNGLAANTVNGIISILKSSLNRAAVLEVAKPRLADAIVRPRMREKQVQSFSKTEQRRIEEYIAVSAKDKLFGITLCLYTGLRIGELIALKWIDVDLIKGVIAVSKSCHDDWADGRYVKVIDTPKTECSKRLIPVPRQLLSRLRAMKKRTDGEYIVRGKSAYGADSYDPAAEIKVNITKATNCPNGYYYVIGSTAHFEEGTEYSFNTNTTGEITIAVYARGGGFDGQEVYYLDSRQTASATLNLLGYPSQNSINVNQDGQITWGKVNGASGYLFKLSIVGTDGKNYVYTGSINSNTASFTLTRFNAEDENGESVELKYSDVKTMSLELQAKGTLTADRTTSGNGSVTSQKVTKEWTSDLH